MAEFNFPDDTIPFEKKDDRYLLQWCQAVFRYSIMYPKSAMQRQNLQPYNTDGRGMSWATNWIETNRLYAQGNQSTWNYQQKYAATKGEGGEDMSFINMDWDIESFATKLVNIIVERVMKRWRYISCIPLDPEAVDDERMAFFSDLAKVKNKGALAQIRGMMGLPMEDKAKGEDEDEVMIE